MVAFSALLALAAAEGALRLSSSPQPLQGNKRRTVSPQLGWVNLPNIERRYEERGYGEIFYSSSVYGFRRFDGEDSARKTRVLFIGDSFTAAGSVSDGKAFYDVIGRLRPDTAIFAYGGGGYGSLQEAMILDLYIDRIQPDLVVWQFFSNDIVNNVHRLESLSLHHNNQMTRPYLEDGEVVYRFPDHRLAVFDCAPSWSRVMQMAARAARIAVAELLGSIEDELEPGHPLLEEAESVTANVMALVKRRCGEVPVAAFAVDAPRQQLFQRVSERQGIVFLDGIPAAVEQARQAGLRIDGLPYDPHWSAEGHRVAGEAILRKLEAADLLQSRGRKPGPPLRLVNEPGE